MLDEHSLLIGPVGILLLGIYLLWALSKQKVSVIEKALGMTIVLVVTLLGIWLTLPQTVHS